MILNGESTFHPKKFAWGKFPALKVNLMQRTDSLEKTLMMGNTEGKRRKGCQRIRWSDSITDSMNMNLSKLWKIMENRGSWYATVLEVTKSWT